MSNEAGFLTDASGTPISSTTPLQVSGSLTVAGGQTPGDAVANPTDASDSRSFVQLWDPTAATWVRGQTVHANPGSLLVNNPTGSNLHVVADTGSTTVVTGNVTVIGASTPSDTFANPTTAAVAQTFGMVWSQTDSDWDRAISASADALASTLGITAAGTMVFNGTTWDRGVEFSGAWANTVQTGVVGVGVGLSSSTTQVNALRSASNVGDANGLANGLPVGNWAWNGSTFDKWRTAGASVTASIGRGAVATGVAATQSLNAVVATGAGTSVDLGVAVSNPAMEVLAASVTTGGTIRLEGSLEGTNWYTINTGTITANGTTAVVSTGTVPIAARFLRANLATRTDGTYSAWVAGA